MSKYTVSVTRTPGYHTGLPTVKFIVDCSAPSMAAAYTLAIRETNRTAASQVDVLNCDPWFWDNITPYEFREYSPETDMIIVVDTRKDGPDCFYAVYKDITVKQVELDDNRATGIQHLYDGLVVKVEE